MLRTARSPRAQSHREGELRHLSPLLQAGSLRGSWGTRSRVLTVLPECKLPQKHFTFYFLMFAYFDSVSKTFDSIVAIMIVISFVPMQRNLV